MKRMPWSSLAMIVVLSAVMAASTQSWWVLALALPTSAAAYWRGRNDELDRHRDPPR